MSIEAIAAVSAAATDPLLAPAATNLTATSGGSFSQLLVDGLDGVNQKLVDADQLASAFALDDSIPVHQVTMALEEARLSVELMLQVRSRLVEGYQELMRMQL